MFGFLVGGLLISEVVDFYIFGRRGESVNSSGLLLAISVGGRHKRVELLALEDLLVDLGL